MEVFFHLRGGRGRGHIIGKVRAPFWFCQFLLNRDQKKNRKEWDRTTHLLEDHLQPSPAVETSAISEELSTACSTASRRERTFTSRTGQILEDSAPSNLFRERYPPQPSPFHRGRLILVVLVLPKSPPALPTHTREPRQNQIPKPAHLVLIFSHCHKCSDCASANKSTSQTSLDQ